jgi:hypothetical protein
MKVAAATFFVEVFTRAGEQPGRAGRMRGGAAGPARSRWKWRCLAVKVALLWRERGAVSRFRVFP